MIKNGLKLHMSDRSLRLGAERRLGIRFNFTATTNGVGETD
jgi:hypothetical protein